MTEGRERKLYDVIVVGGGIAGLAAAMNAASDNQSVLLLEGAERHGGQGGSTNDIRNLFGFPEGISGEDLVSRGLEHCTNFGVEFMTRKQIIRVTAHPGGQFTVSCDDRTTYSCRAIIVACGLKYRRLEVPGEDRYMGFGVAHGFPLVNNALWEGKRVGVVGGGNSGAQSCLFLTECDRCEVTFLVRGPSLAASMSGMYLPHFVPGKISNLDVRLQTVVKEIYGDRNRVAGVVVDGPSGEQRIALDHLCIMVGAVPHTGWLEEIVDLDKYGFILTDRDLRSGRWLLTERQPLFCETSVPGIFAVGDVRKGNERRRATSAVNDGMQGAASAVQYLTEIAPKRASLVVVGKTA